MQKVENNESNCSKAGQNRWKLLQRVENNEGNWCKRWGLTKEIDENEGK